MKRSIFGIKKSGRSCLTAHIKRAYRLIGSATPISADCGELCSAACCSSPEGAESEYGMLLFPGEEHLLKNDPHFTLSKLPSAPGFSGSVWFATCDGSCDRKHRPLSCRIFPAIPYLAPSQRKDPAAFPAVIPDPRAAIVCPLVAHGANHIEEQFCEAVARAAVALRKCPVHRKFLDALSALCDDYRKFLG